MTAAFGGRLEYLSTETGSQSGAISDLEFDSRAAEWRARAARARELAGHLSDKEARRGVLRYADDLDNEAARLEAGLAGRKPGPMAIDVI